MKTPRLCLLSRFHYAYQAVKVQRFLHTYQIHRNCDVLTADGFIHAVKYAVQIIYYGANPLEDPMHFNKIASNAPDYMRK